MKIKEFVVNIVNMSKSNIIELAQTELANGNKKMVLDSRIYYYIEQAIDKLKINFFIKTAFKKILLPNVSILTQIIYDLIKLRVEGVTR